MNDDEVLERVGGLGLSLPTPTAPLAAYVPCVIAGSLAFVAGQVPMQVTTRTRKASFSGRSREVGSSAGV